MNNIKRELVTVFIFNGITWPELYYGDTFDETVIKKGNLSFFVCCLFDYLSNKGGEKIPTRIQQKRLPIFLEA